MYIQHDFDGDNGALYVITGNQGVSADTDSFEVEQSQERAVVKRSPFLVLILLMAWRLNVRPRLLSALIALLLLPEVRILNQGFRRLVVVRLSRVGWWFCKDDPTVSSNLVSILSSNSVFTVFIQHKFAGSPLGSTDTITGNQTVYRATTQFDVEPELDYCCVVGKC